MEAVTKEVQVCWRSDRCQTFVPLIVILASHPTSLESQISVVTEEI